MMNKKKNSILNFFKKQEKKLVFLLVHWKDKKDEPKDNFLKEIFQEKKAGLESFQENQKNKKTKKNWPKI